jgi:hypothetical protein
MEGYSCRKRQEVVFPIGQSPFSFPGIKEVPNHRPVDRQGSFRYTDSGRDPPDGKVARLLLDPAGGFGRISLDNPVVVPVIDVEIEGQFERIRRIVKKGEHCAPKGGIIPDPDGQESVLPAILPDGHSPFQKKRYEIKKPPRIPGEISPVVGCQWNAAFSIFDPAIPFDPVERAADRGGCRQNAESMVAPGERMKKGSGQISPVSHGQPPFTPFRSFGFPKSRDIESDRCGEGDIPFHAFFPH